MAAHRGLPHREKSKRLNRQPAVRESGGLSVLFINPFQLVGDPGGAVPDVDGAAAPETVLFQQLLHFVVVPVGVRPEIRAPPAAAKCQTLLKCPAPSDPVSRWMMVP